MAGGGCRRFTPMDVSGKHGGSIGGSPYDMSSSDRCWRCSAVVDAGAPVPTDDLRSQMAEGAGSYGNSSSSLSTRYSLNNSLRHCFAAD